jgi:hypothetical protein
MSHSVPSESSAIDTAFLVGTDLVEFDRRDLPIYQTPEGRWAEACVDEAPYGAPLDRVFGEPGDIHLDGTAIDGLVHDDQQANLATMPSEDPLVVLAALSDGLSLPGSEAAAPEIATAFDFGSDAHAVVHLHDGFSWDIAGTDWTFDFQV